MPALLVSRRVIISQKRQQPVCHADGEVQRELVQLFDDAQRGEADPAARAALRTKANEELAAMVRAETTDALNKVLFELSSGMKNAYARSDA